MQECTEGTQTHTEIMKEARTGSGPRPKEPSDSPCRRLWSSGVTCSAISAFAMALSGLAVKLMRTKVPTFEVCVMCVRARACSSI